MNWPIHAGAHLAELEAANRWIPVGERLPVLMGMVEIAAVGLRAVGFVTREGVWLDRHGQIENVTHWRPLAAGPEGE